MGRGWGSLYPGIYHLVLDGIALLQTDLVSNLRVLLDSKIIKKCKWMEIEAPTKVIHRNDQCHLCSMLRLRPFLIIHLFWGSLVVPRPLSSHSGGPLDIVSDVLFPVAALFQSRHYIKLGLSYRETDYN